MNLTEQRLKDAAADLKDLRNLISLAAEDSYPEKLQLEFKFTIQDLEKLENQFKIMIRKFNDFKNPCDCDLRDRAWNPHSGYCETCRRMFVSK